MWTRLTVHFFGKTLKYQEVGTFEEKVVVFAVSSPTETYYFAHMIFLVKGMKDKKASFHAYTLESTNLISKIIA